MIEINQVNQNSGAVNNNCGGGLRVSECEVTIPEPGRAPSHILCFGWLKLADEHGNGLTINDLCLLRTERGGHNIHLTMPNAPKSAKCDSPGCRGRNCQAAKYCNWCGSGLQPVHQEYSEKIGPLTAETRRLMTDAMLAALAAAKASQKSDGR